MRQLINIIKADFQREGVTTKEFVIYGVVAPITLIAFCLLAEIINQI